MRDNRFTPADWAVLETREARLASNVRVARAAEEALLVFERSGRRFALPLEYLLGVRAMPKLTSFPGSPSLIEGLAHLSGRVVALVDLERIAGGTPAQAAGWVVWVGNAKASLLVAADELDTIVHASAPPAEQGAFSGPLARALRTVLPGPLLVLDPAVLLDPDFFHIS